MQGGNKRTGKRNLSGRENDLEEYFSDLESDEVNPNDGFHPSGTIGKRAEGLSASEELRRLTVYVVHLRDRILGMERSHENAKTLTKPSRFTPALAGLAAMIAMTVFITAMNRRKCAVRSRRARTDC